MTTPYEIKDKLRFEWLWSRYCWKRKHNWFDKKEKTYVRLRYNLIMLGCPEIMQYTNAQIAKGIQKFGEALSNLGVTAKRANQALAEFEKNYQTHDN